MSSSSILPPLMRVPLVDPDPVAMRTSTAPDRAAESPLSAKPDLKPSKPADTQTADPKPTNTTVRKTAIDWETGAMVYRVIDEHSGTTVSQSPDEALLRLRAYARQSELEANTGNTTVSTGQTREPVSGPTRGSPQDQTAPAQGLTPRPSKTV